MAYITAIPDGHGLQIGDVTLKLSIKDNHGRHVIRVAITTPEKRDITRLNADGEVVRKLA